nr:peptidylprolyl isomerase [Kofleriaceae bacterium]
MASLALASLTACEHKSPHDEGGNGDGKNPWNEPGTAKPVKAGSNGPAMGGAMGAPDSKMAAPAVATDQQPTGDVRPPTAADLADYTKDIKGSGPLTATITTSMGPIHCELLPDKAPMTVANFVGLATGKKAWLNPKTGEVEKGKPLYDGLTFHRVMHEFMIQGGDPLGTGTGGPGYKFADEFSPDVKMAPGTLAMANSGVATNGSQFFITDGTPDWLNGKHTIFGRCKEVDLVKQIEDVPATRTRPNTPVTIDKVTFSK